MEAKRIPCNALIIGPTNSGKTKYLLDQLCGPFRGTFDYIVLVCPTFIHNKSYDAFAENDDPIFVVVPPADELQGTERSGYASALAVYPVRKNQHLTCSG